MSKFPESIDHGPELVSDRPGIANVFNKHFVNVGIRTVKESVAANNSEQRNKFEDYLPQSSLSSLFLTPTSKEELTNIVNLLKPGGAEEIDVEEKSPSFNEEEQHPLKKSKMENSDDDSMFLGGKKKLTKTQCNDIEDVEFEADSATEDVFAGVEMRIIALFTILIRTFAVKSSRALREIYIPDSEENSEDELVEKDDDEDNIDDICRHVKKSSLRDLHSRCENKSEEELKDYRDESDNGEEDEFFEDIRASPALDFAFDKESYDLEENSEDKFVEKDDDEGNDICRHVKKSSLRDLHSRCENKSEEELKDYRDESDNGEEDEFFEDIRASPALDFAFDKESYDLEENSEDKFVEKDDDEGTLAVAVCGIVSQAQQLMSTGVYYRSPAVSRALYALLH
ncbi:hypothetical protein QYM36_019263 [Artemia franciscana]|uniref:Uncharacterized protein n=1 Tax=Artemia franciscana TaxID=6661 RepID=A0AA88KR26_ARTSF|nr:hypothetical protein QYM36_019263 [Artemia franciscana]